MIQNTTPSNFQVERLFVLAFERTKSRFLSYFLTLLIEIGIFLGFGVIVSLVALILFLIFSLTNSYPLLVFLIASLSIIGIIILIYIVSWIQLTLVEILIQEKRMGVLDTFRKVKPLIWGYVWFGLLLFFFTFGLLPLGILSIFIIPLLWSFWSSFSVFVYLEEKRKGLENLWQSRAIINQKFWAVLGRIALLTLAVFMINIVLFSVKNGFARFLATILSWFTTPFIISYGYEIYCNLEKPATVKRPKVWIALSIIGGILLLVGLAYGISFLIQNASSLKLPPLVKPGVKMI